MLGVSTVVSMLALAGLHAARSQLAAATQGADRAEARVLAQSAIEHAMAVLRNDANWRTNYVVDTAYPATPVAAGRGTFTWRLTSAGGLNRTLSGTGLVGDATCTLTVDLAQPPDLDCALLVEGQLRVEGDCSLTVEDAPAATNDEFRVDGAVTANIEAQTISNNGSITGAQTAPAGLRVLPQSSMVLDYWKQAGTELNSSMLLSTVLSPYANPLGTPNTHGIYVIKSSGNNVTISNCRIVGTLVVADLEPGRVVSITGSVNWEPAYPHYPALLVDGDVEINLVHTDLTEWFLTPSFNPVGTPFQGQEDSDKSDVFISSIAGLIYCSGNLTIKGNGSSDRFPDLRGQILVGKDCHVQSRTFPTIKFDESSSLTPPPGFDQTAPVVLVPGSWR